MRHSISLIVAAIAIAIAATQPAAAQQKPEEALKMRQGLMQAVKMNFGPIGAWMQGKAELPADATAKAENVAALGKIAQIAWAKGTESLSGANTKPEAFGSADFAKGWVMMSEAALKLQAATASGNADATKAAAADVGKTCKGCHDNFRKE